MSFTSEATEGLKLNKTSLIDLVPKLKGKSNYADWKSKLFMALGAIDKGYVELLCNDTVPRPSYKETILPTGDEVLQLQEIFGLSIHAAVDYKIQEIETENAALKTKYEITKRKWDIANVSAYVLLKHTLDPIPALQIETETSAYVAFQILKAQYAQSSFRAVFAPFQKLNNLRYKGGNAAEFARPSQEAFRERSAVADEVHPAYELRFCLSSIVDNGRRYAFTQRLQVVNTSQNMNKVCLSFVQSDQEQALQVTLN